MWEPVSLIVLLIVMFALVFWLFVLMDLRIRNTCKMIHSLLDQMDRLREFGNVQSDRLDLLGECIKELSKRNG